ncbi:MAG: cyclic nucleotide-binding domain-containing protein [Nitrospinota bacterium]|nr:cyclic nucleotide-binding domain-containing protein [Nitrospinota bacterium]
MSAPYIFIKRGDVLFHEGSQSDCAYIINSGRLEVSKGCGKGEKEIIGFLENSDIVGEMGLIDGRPRSATVTATKNTRVSKITKEQFQSLSEKNPKALMPVMKVMVKRMRETLNLVKDLRKQSTGNLIFPAGSVEH